MLDTIFGCHSILALTRMENLSSDHQGVWAFFLQFFSTSSKLFIPLGPCDSFPQKTEPDYILDSKTNNIYENEGNDAQTWFQF